MTDTTISEIADDGNAQPIGTLEHLDPAMLQIGDNVRDDVALRPHITDGVFVHKRTVLGSATNMRKVGPPF